MAGGGDQVFEARTGSMQTHAVNGAAAIGLAQLIKLPFQAASLLFLPRLLQPIDYGIYAMVDPLISIGGLIISFGLFQAIIQAPALRRDEVNGLFWIMTGAGVLGALLMLISAPFVADFYNEPRVMAVTAVSSLFLLQTGVLNVPEALMTRQMKFGWLAMIGAVGVAVGLIVSVACAFAGLEYWSLTIGYGATCVVTFIGTWMGVGWLPTGPIKLRGLLHFFKFGGTLMVSDAAMNIARDADAMLIGRYVGGAPLGFYDRGNKLAIIPMQRISQVLQTVLLPVLSRMSEEGERYRRAYLRIISQLMLWLTPGVVAVGATAPVLIPFLLGEQWAPAAPIFAWLTLSALHRPVSMTMNLLFISQGRAQAYFAWSVFSAVTSLISFIVGLQWGAIGVAAAFALSDLFVRLPFLWWCVTRKGPISQADLYATAAPFAVSCLATLTALLTVQMLPFPNAFTQLAVCALFAYAVSWGVVSLFPHGRATLVDALVLGRTELPRLAMRALGRRRTPEAP